MTILHFLLLFIFLSNSIHSITSSTPQTWIKAGYWYTGSSSPIPNINSALFTHLICAFAYINTSTHDLFLAVSDQPYISAFASTVKRNNPSVIPLLSIWTQNGFPGALENSSSFLTMADQPAYRKSFIESSIKTARLYGFQGLDLYVTTLLSTNGNMTNLATLFNEWRVAVDSESKRSSKDEKKLILTLAGHYLPELDSVSYPVDSVDKNFDWVQLRSYDYHTPLTDNFTAGHTALYDPSSRVNTDYGITEWIRRGLPASKLVLGLAYHGYAWTLVDPKDNGIGAPAKGLAITRDGSLSYEYIRRYLRDYRVNSVYNSTYVINYCAIGSFWIGFDDKQAIKTKVAYAKEKGLIGYSVWQVPNDYNWELSKAAVVSVIIQLLGCIICYRRRRTIVSKVKQMMNRGKTSSPNQQVISFDVIKEATNSFLEENKLGEGGYGPVYKGWVHVRPACFRVTRETTFLLLKLRSKNTVKCFYCEVSSVTRWSHETGWSHVIPSPLFIQGKLSNGQEIAVKRLSHDSKQGLEEFKNEVTFASKLQHVNLVKLLGFCTERDEMMLVYEYMPNKSLDFYLYDPSRRSMMNWERWVDIIEGIIQGLLYLQEYSRLTIVHRDLKASNILLDAEMKPRISDFGIAKSFQNNETEANTDRIVGTYGCVPPEYIKQGTYSRKYDVYSFGVLLLQIISGKKNYSVYGPHQNLNLLEYAYVLWKEGSGMEFIDPSLDDASSTYKLIKCMQVALLCVEEKWEYRPSMLEVSTMLNNDNANVPIPTRPAFSTNKDEEKGTTAKEVISVNIATISQLLPR